MKEFTNIYAKKIHEILKPLVGENMAYSVIKTQTGKIGITEESINGAHLEKIASGIKIGLTVFVGSEAAQSVSDKIQAIK